MNYHNFILLLGLLTILSGCATSPQKIYWGAETATAADLEERRNYREAELKYKEALWRARNQIGEDAISDSLYNLGTFYLRRGRIHDGITLLNESLTIEEKLTGKLSKKTGRRVTYLIAAYLEIGYWNEAHQLSERLPKYVPLFSGQEQETIIELIEEFDKQPDSYDKEIKDLTLAAEHNDPKAHYNLATYYEDGRGVSQDYKRAIELYQRSAQNGYLSAQQYLGVIYDKGRGTAVNHVKARKWYRMAAKGGHAIGQYNYGIYLIKGRGGPTNREEGLNWLREAAKQGYQPAIRAHKYYQ